MYDALALGPFVIRWQVIAMTGAVLIGRWLATTFIRKTFEPKSSVVVRVFDHSIWIGLLVWKFSLALFQPATALHHPSALLFFSGGYKGWMLAIVATAGYWLYESKKHSLPSFALLQSAGIGFAAGNAFYYGFVVAATRSDRYYPFGQIIASVLFAVWFYKKRSATAVVQGIVWFGIGQMFLDFWKNGRVAVGLGLSAKQSIFLVVVLFGLFALSFVKQEELVRSQRDEGQSTRGA